MINISNNFIITINHGDYFRYPLFINAGDEFIPLRYILEDNDKVYFSIVEPNQPFECGVVRKIFTKHDLNSYGDAVITLTSEDTINLLPGNYYYEIKLSIVRDDKEYLETVVPRRKFYIL